MSDFSEEFPRRASEDEHGGAAVVSGAGMHYPWLQKLVETVGKWHNMLSAVKGGGELQYGYNINN